MKFTGFLFLFMLLACKPQQNSNTQLPSASDYQPNPDEAVFQLKLITSEKTEKGWENTVEVIRHFRSGFGHKNRLRPGMSIVLISRERINSSNFYCSAEYQLSTDNSNKYVLREYLKE